MAPFRFGKKKVSSTSTKPPSPHITSNGFLSTHEENNVQLNQRQPYTPKTSQDHSFENGNSSMSSTQADLSFTPRSITPKPSGNSYKKINNNLPSNFSPKTTTGEIMYSPISLMNNKHNNHNMSNNTNTYSPHQGSHSENNSNFSSPKELSSSRNISGTSSFSKNSPSILNQNKFKQNSSPVYNTGKFVTAKQQQYHQQEEPSPWNRVKLPVSPFPRYRHVASAVSTPDSNKIYIIGGLHDQSVYGDTWILKYSRENSEQQQIIKHIDNISSDNSSQSMNSNANLEYQDQGKLLFQSKTIEISDLTPPPRVGHAATLCGNAFVIFGGDTHKVNSNGMMDDDVYLLNTNSLKWTIPTQVGPRPLARYGHKINVIQSTAPQTNTTSTKLYVFGGQFDDTYFNDLCSYDLSSFRRPDSHWVFLKPKTFIPPPITNHSMCVYENKLWVFGGDTSQGLLNEVFMYDPSINDWSVVPTTSCAPSNDLPPPVQEHSCVVYKDLMCVFGGKDENDIYTNDLWFLNLKTLQWWKFPNDNDNKFLPSPRSGHSLTLLPNENKLLIMGGDKLDYSASPDLDNVLDISESKDYGYGSILYTFDLLSLEKYCPGIFDHSPKFVNSAPSSNISSPKLHESALAENTHISHETQTQADPIEHSGHYDSNNEYASPLLDQELPRSEQVPNIDDLNNEPDTRRNTTISERATQRGVSDFFDTYTDEVQSVLIRGPIGSGDGLGRGFLNSAASSMILNSVADPIAQPILNTDDLNILQSDPILSNPPELDVESRHQTVDSFPNEEDIKLETADQVVKRNVGESPSKSSHEAQVDAPAAESSTIITNDNLYEDFNQSVDDFMNHGQDDTIQQKNTDQEDLNETLEDINENNSDNNHLERPAVVQKYSSINTKLMLEELANELMEIKMDTYKQAQLASDRIKELETENIKLKSFSNLNLSSPFTNDTTPFGNENEVEKIDYKTKFLELQKNHDELLEKFNHVELERENYKKLYNGEKLKLVSYLKKAIMNLEDEFQ